MSDRPHADDRDHTGRQFRTLEQCALHKRSLRLTCPACRHDRVLDAIALWWLFTRRGWDDRLTGVSDHLCCETCRGERNAVVRPAISLTRDPPSGPQPPYPDQREWKRLVSRYRS